MSKISENVSFLRAVIYHAAKEMFDYHSCNGEIDESVIGPGEIWESREAWISDMIKNWMEIVSKKIHPFDLNKDEIHKEMVDEIKKFYLLPFSKKSKFGNGEIMRVPGGWIYETSPNGIINSTFIPYNREFQDLIEGG